MKNSFSASVLRKGIRYSLFLFTSFLFLPLFTAQAANNVLISITLQDTNANGKINRAVVSIDNDTPSTAAVKTIAGWSATDGGAGVTVSAVALASAANADPLLINVDLDETDADLTVDTLNADLEIIYAQQGADAGTEYTDAGDVQLVAIATGDAGTNTEVDAALPIVLTKVYQDNGANGSVDRAVLTLSELVNFTEANLLSDFTFVAQGLTGFTGNPSAIAGTGTATLTFTVAATTNLTGVSGGTQPTIAFTDDGANHLADAAANALATFGAASLTDAAVPVIVSAGTLDVGTDGTTYNGIVDHLKLTFSEGIDDSVIQGYGAAADYTPTSLAVANVTGEAIDAVEILGDTEDNNILYVIFTESGTCSTTVFTGCTTSTVDQDITWTGASVVFRDVTGNEIANLVSGGVTEADTAAPYILGSNYYDNNGNGTIDYLVLIFSESVSDASYVNRSSTISAGGTLTTAAIVAATTVALDAAANDRWITLAIASGAANTTNITATFNAVAADMIDDAVGISSLNQSSVAMADKAAPIVVTVTSDNQTYYSTISAVSIVFTFSESLTTGPTVSISGDAQTVTGSGATRTVVYTLPIINTVTKTISLTLAADAGPNVMTANTAHTFIVNTRSGSGPSSSGSSVTLAPTTSATAMDVINRPVSLVSSAGKVTSPLKLSVSENFYLEFASGTQIKTADGQVYAGLINAPELQSGMYAPRDTMGGLQRAVVFVGFPGKDLVLSAPAKVVIPLSLLPGTKTEDVKVYSYDTATKAYQVVGNGGTMPAKRDRVEISTSKLGQFVVLERQSLGQTAATPASTAPAAPVVPQASSEAPAAPAVVPSVEVPVVDMPAERKEAIIAKVEQFYETPKAFNDVTENDWSQEYIEKVSAAGIMTGYEDGSDNFGKTDSLTKSQVVKVALESFGYDVPESVDESPYSGVDASDWSAPYFQAAVEEGLDLSGTSANGDIPRGEALRLMLDAAGVDLSDISDSDNGGFSDVSLGKSYTKAVVWAAQNGVVSGYEPGEDGMRRFGPNDTLTREQFAKIVVNVLELLGQ